MLFVTFVPDDSSLSSCLIPHTQTVVVFSGGFSYGGKQLYHHLLTTIKVIGHKSLGCICENVRFLAYPLLLNIHHSIMNGDKDMLRVHVVH